MNALGAQRKGSAAMHSEKAIDHRCVTDKGTQQIKPDDDTFEKAPL